MKRLGALIVACAAVGALWVAGAAAHSGHTHPAASVDRATLDGLFGVRAALGRVADRPADRGKKQVELQVLNVSDWHGQLDPLSNGVGGAGAISAYWQADRAASPNTLTLTAGDAVGATPPLSAFFADEPAIRALRLMGVEVDTFGNHNFDAGLSRLQTQIDLARDRNIPGTQISYVSANLDHVRRALHGVAPWRMFRVGPDRIRVAVVGVTNPEAPTLVFPGSFGPITITDPVAAANRARREARDEGAEIVLLISHMGVTALDPVTGAPSGPLVDLANGVRGFDVVFGDHTDVGWTGILNGQLVLENRSKGATYARTKVVIERQRDHRSKLISASTTLVTPTASAVTPDPAIEAMLAPFRSQVSAIFSTQIGTSSVAIPRADSCGNSLGRTCESLIGDLATDAMRSTYLTEFAITNSGGLRADLTCPVVDLPTDFCPAFTPAPYPITRGQVLGVLPFGNVVSTLSITGAELKTYLENGVSTMPAVNGRFPQVSGLCFTYDISAAAGSRVTGVVRQVEDGSCTGAAVDLSSGSNYSLAINDFMASGGDGYPNVASRQVTRGIMDAVVADFITAQGVVSPALQGRIVCSTSGASVCPVAAP